MDKYFLFFPFLIGLPSICYTSSTPAQILEETGCLYTDPQLFGSRRDGSPLMIDFVSDTESKFLVLVKNPAF